MPTRNSRENISSEMLILAKASARDVALDIMQCKLNNISIISLKLIN
jgi:hypothetical protein